MSTGTYKGLFSTPPTYYGRVCTPISLCASYVMSATFLAPRVLLDGYAPTEAYPVLNEGCGYLSATACPVLTYTTSYAPAT
eukprot:3935443-Rhodomonas_salina.3